MWNIVGYSTGIMNPICLSYDKALITITKAIMFDPYSLAQITGFLGAGRYFPGKLIDIADKISDAMGLSTEIDDECGQFGIGFNDISQRNKVLRMGDQNAQMQLAARSLLELGDQGQHTYSVDGGSRRNTRKRNTRKRNTRKRNRRN